MLAYRRRLVFLLTVSMQIVNEANELNVVARGINCSEWLGGFRGAGAAVLVAFFLVAEFPPLRLKNFF